MRSWSSVLLGAALMAATGLAQAQEYSWDLSGTFADGSLATQGDMLFARLVEEKTNGAIKITVHTNGSLGFKASDHPTAVEDGALILATSPTSVFVGYDQIFHIGTMPFLAASPQQAKALWDVSLPYFNESLKGNGQIIVSGYAFPSNGFWAKKPIVNEADLKEWKVRVYDPIGQRVMTEAGAAPINLVWNDLIPALSTGTAEGVLTAPDAGLASNINDFLSHFVQINYVIPNGAIHMNLGTFESLPVEYQQAILDAGREATAWVFKELEVRLEQNYDEMRRRGMTVIVDPPAEFVGYLRPFGEAILNEWIAEQGETGTKIVAEYRAAIGQ